SRAEALDSTGVVTVVAELASSVAVTFSRSGGGTVTKTVTGNGATAVPVVLTDAELNTLGTGVISVSAVATDTAGNVSSRGNFAQTLSFDGLLPVVSSVTDNITGIVNTSTGNVVYTFTFNKTIYGLTVSDFTVVNGTVSNVTGVGTSWTVNVTPQANVASGAISLTMADRAVMDGAGNYSSGTYTNNAQLLDTLAPTIGSLSLGAPIANLPLQLNQLITAVVSFNETVTVTGTPTLALTVGSSTVQASYKSGSGSNQLLFTYVIASGLADSDGVSVTAGSLTLPSGAGIIDLAGNNAVLSYAAVANNPLLTVDSEKPSFRLTTSSDATSTIITTGSTTLTFTFNEPVQGFVASDVNLSVTTNGQIITLSSSNFTKVDETHYTLDVGGFWGQGTLNISVNAGLYQDNNSNSNNAQIISRDYNRTIDLGTYGKLIAGVEVEGVWYYLRDVNADGLITTLDYVTYTQAVNPFNSGGAITNTSGIVNGYNLALPSVTLGSAVLNNGEAYISRTAASGQGTTPNATHDGLSAVWDAFNGTDTVLLPDQPKSGVPSGWGAPIINGQTQPGGVDEIWSATQGITAGSNVGRLLLYMKEGFASAADISDVTSTQGYVVYTVVPV
ncbi:MAG: Ig-like domain-containing protein, partial [Methylophilaceae bacterium]|nr:Ig-like domain-containing protein [Methylophilaceae bacterium]